MFYLYVESKQCPATDTDSSSEMKEIHYRDRFGGESLISDTDSCQILHLYPLQIRASAAKQTISVIIWAPSVVGFAIILFESGDKGCQHPHLQGQRKATRGLHASSVSVS